MSGSQIGALKAKLHLKGKTKPGEMISAMNKLGGAFNGAGRLTQAKNVKK